MGFCTCSTPLGNTNIRGREVTPNVIRKLWLARLYKDDGSRNFIDFSGDPKLELEIKFSAAVSREQIFPIGPFENIDMPKGDPLSEAFNSGRSVITQESPRTFTGLLVKSAQKMLGILQSFGCEEIGFYIVDSCGNVTGLGDDNSAELYPIPVSNGSWYPRWIPATDTTIAKVQLDFQVDLSVNDADLRVVSDAYIREKSATGYVSALNYLGLTEMFVDITASTETGLSFTAKTFAGQAVEGIPAEGIIAQDVKIRKQDGTFEDATTVTSTGLGTYNVTYPSVGAGTHKLYILTDYIAGRTSLFALKAFTVS